MRPTDLMPKHMMDELIRLEQTDPDWCYITTDTNNPLAYTAHSKLQTWLKKTWQTGSDVLSMKAAAVWLAQGPKVFKPSPTQCKAMEQIDVNLMLDEYSQPFPALLVRLTGDYTPFHSVLCFHGIGIFAATLFSKDNLDDITTTVKNDGLLLEESLRKFDPDVGDVTKPAHRALRVACNSCLALSNYGHRLEHLFPKEVERDRHLARENNERGIKARERLSLQVMSVSFLQEIKLHRTIDERDRYYGTPTERTVQSHWRRGHWRMHRHGPQLLLRKRILIKPVLVNAKAFSGDLTDTGAIYKG